MAINYLQEAQKSLKNNEIYTESILYVPDNKCKPHKKIICSIDNISDELMFYCMAKKDLLNELNKQYINDPVLADNYLEYHQRVEKRICESMNILKNHPNGHRGFPDAILRLTRLPIEIKAVHKDRINNPSFDFKEINDYIINTYNNPFNLFAIYDINYYKIINYKGKEYIQIIGCTEAPIWDLTGPMASFPEQITLDNSRNTIRPVKYWNNNKTFNSPEIFVKYVANTAKIINNGNFIHKRGKKIDIDIRVWEKRMRCFIKKYIELPFIYRDNLFSDIPFWANKEMNKIWKKIYHLQTKKIISCSEINNNNNNNNNKLNDAMQPYERFAIYDATEEKYYASTKEWVQYHKHFAKTEHAIIVRVDAHLHDRVETCYGHLLLKVSIERKVA